MDVIAGSISTYVFTIARGRAQFLLLKRAPGLLHADTWQAVHGMIEHGEKAHEAARRECVEESGLTPERFFRTDFVETFYSEHTDGVHLVPAFAAFVSEAPTPVLSEEHTEHAWLSLNEATERFVFPSQRRAIQLIADCTHRWPDVAVGMYELAL